MPSTAEKYSRKKKQQHTKLKFALYANNNACEWARVCDELEMCVSVCVCEWVSFDVFTSDHKCNLYVQFVFLFSDWAFSHAPHKTKCTEWQNNNKKITTFFKAMVSIIDKLQQEHYQNDYYYHCANRIEQWLIRTVNVRAHWVKKRLLSSVCHSYLLSCVDILSFKKKIQIN